MDGDGFGVTFVGVTFYILICGWAPLDVAQRVVLALFCTTIACALVGL